MELAFLLLCVSASQRRVTLLNLLGFDDNKLTYYRAGRYKQLS